MFRVDCRRPQRSHRQQHGRHGHHGARWSAAELAVHAYDLATALGRATADLDPEIAETGYAFMSSSMSDDMRGEAFGPQQPAPADADAYQRIAAFAGRPV